MGIVVFAALLVVVGHARPAGVPPVTVAVAAPQPTGYPGITVVSHPHAFTGYQIGPDTDLRTPSGLTAAQIDAFLAGSPMAGLGATFIDAEQQFHVNARYLVAHAIEESAWGSSAIAQDKHNLYGYGADDWNPYGDAVTFSSFTEDIEFQARMVATDYLTPGGPHWGGAPTLNGMHVHYASDPHWVELILDVAARLPQ